MGITKADLDAQYAMLKRGDEKRKAAKQAEDRERLRDTFAAAALTGLLADDGDRTEHAMLNFTARAYEWADAMLLQRNGAADARETVCPYVRGTVTQHCALNFTLTDEERAAIETAADLFIGSKPGATLRNLLERLR